MAVSPVTRTSFASYDQDDGQTGIAAKPNGSVPIGTGTRTMQTNRAYFVRFRPSRNMTITKIAFNVTAADTSDNPCDVGIYNSALTTKIVSSGATTGKINSTGVQTVTVTATPLTAGTVYYAAIAIGTVSTSLTLAGFGINTADNLFYGTSDGQYFAAFKDTSYTLPASLTGGTNNTLAAYPTLILRES